MTKHHADRSWKTLLEILIVSTRLGLTSFGGPIAHLGYFHAEYIRKRKWLDEKTMPTWLPYASSSPVQPAARSGSGSA